MITDAARVAGEILWWRWRLPRIADRMPLPELLERLTPHGAPEGPGQDLTFFTVRVAEAAARKLRLKNTCLFRSLARYRVYRRRGLPVVFVIGARGAPDGELHAHAWLELDGKALAEPESPESFRVLLRFPASASAEPR